MTDEKDFDACRCSECETEIPEGQGIQTDSGVFCDRCYNRLLSELETISKYRGVDINYAMAAIGALAGGAIGITAWWGFTFLTKYAFGLIAIVIGITVAKGIDIATKGKRSKGLQIMALGVTLVSYFYADYLVTRSFLIAQNIEFAISLTIIPDPIVFFNVSKINFDAMSLVFLGIALWQAYRMTQPVHLVKIPVSGSDPAEQGGK